jgi:hypothetical protein
MAEIENLGQCLAALNAAMDHDEKALELITRVNDWLDRSDATLTEWKAPSKPIRDAGHFNNEVRGVQRVALMHVVHLYDLVKALETEE